MNHADDLTLAHLRIIVEVTARGSISSAASALGHDQSTVSRQLRGAETAVGVVLFERTTTGVRLTSSGHALLPHARRVLAELEAAQSDLATLRGGLSGSLRVGAFPTANAWVVPAAMSAVLRRHPAIVPELTEASSPTLVKRVRSGLLHGALIAIGSGLPEHDLDGLARVSMPPGPGVGVAVASGDPLIDLATLRPEHLAGRHWVVGAGDRGDPQFDVWPGAEAPHVAFRVRSWQARIGVVRAGLAISVIPAITAPILPDGVVWLPVDDPAFDGRRMMVVTPGSPSAGAQAFAAAVDDVVRRIGIARELPHRDHLV